MSRGDAAFFLGFVVTGDPTVVAPLPIDEDLELEECCYILPLLVEKNNPAIQDPFKNDQTSYFEFYDKSISAVSLILTKCVNKVIVDQVTIIDNTYGTFLDLGVETHDGLDYISIKNINWTLIFDTFGAGEYQFRTDETSIFSSTPLASKFDFQYDLQEFTTRRANTTVFMRIFNSGILVDKKNNGRTQFTFPDNWVDGKRVSAIFGNDKSGMEESYTAFNNGFEEFVSKKILPRYILEVDPMSEDIREYMEIELRMADLVEMTNTVNNAANRHINTPVQATSDFDPTYFKQVSKAKFELEFKHAFEDNFEKLHC